MKKSRVKSVGRSEKLAITVQSAGIIVFSRNGNVFVRQLILHNCLAKGKASIAVKAQRGMYEGEGKIKLEDANVDWQIDQSAKIILFSDIFVNQEFGLIVSLGDRGKVNFSRKFADHPHLKFFTLEGKEMNADAFAVVNVLP
jgi:hypothetical protein